MSRDPQSTPKQKYARLLIIPTEFAITALCWPLNAIPGVHKANLYNRGIQTKASLSNEEVAGKITLNEICIFFLYYIEGVVITAQCTATFSRSIVLPRF